MDAVEDYTDVLERSRYEIVRRLQLDRTSLFDYLRSKGVFDATDCELVFAEKTREQKASKFLDILESKGKDGFVYFIDVLQLLNAGLYETITGKKANPCRIWENMRDKFALGNCGYVPDVDLLSGQLKRTIDDLQDLALHNQQLMIENQNLGIKLDRASTDLDLKHRRVEVLEKHMNESERVVEAHTNANKLSDAVAQQLRTLQQGIFERNTYIIALQMKLLATEEEIKETRKQQEELRCQHEMLSSKWHNLSKDYDYERRESLKLTAKLKSQRGNLQKVGWFERKCREFKQINEKMIAERDEAVSDLESLKDWTEALKARYDIIVSEYKELQQSFVSSAAEKRKQQEEIEDLRLQLSLSKVGVGDLKGWNEELEETVKKYREQRDFFSESRKTALLERDDIRKERDEAIQRYTDVVKDRDEIINKQTTHSKHFEEKYEKACVELKVLRERILSTEHELEELRVQRNKQRNIEETQDHAQDSTAEKRLNSTASEDNAEGDKNTNPTNDPQIKGFPWKKREAKSIITSIRKRVSETHQEALSLDRKLDLMKVDSGETLSDEARTSLSLQGGKLLFKTLPTYNTMRFMFGLSVGGHMGSLSDVSGGASVTCSKDSSEPSGSSTSGTSQDEALASFERTLGLDADESQSTPINNGASNERPVNHPWPYTKSLSQPILKVNPRRHNSQEGSDNESEKSDNDDELFPEHNELFPGHDEPDGGGDFHWVRKDECSKSESYTEDYFKASEAKTKAEVEEFLKSLSRQRRRPFRKRAWAMKKKERSSSAPTISCLPGKEGQPKNDNTDR